MKAVIYKHTNIITNKIYIGKTVQDPNRRWRKNNKSLNAYVNNKYLTRALTKYGWINFTSEILATCLDNAYINELEAYFIKFYDCLAPKGYNIKAYDENNREEQSQETKDKISKSNIGKKRTKPIWNKKQSIFIEGLEHLQCPKCNTIQKIEQFSFIKRKNKNTNFDYITRKSYCKTCSRLHNSRYKYKRKSEQQVKDSYKQRGKASSKRLKHFYTNEVKRAKSLTYGGYKSINIQTGEETIYECGHDLKELGLKLSSISNVLNKEHLSYKGFRWFKLTLANPN